MRCLYNEKFSMNGGALVNSKRSLLSNINHYRNSYLFIAPFTLVFVTFTAVPVVIALFLSLTQFNVLQMPKLIGLENFRRLLFEDDIFLIAIKNTIVFAVITGPISYFLCLFIAWFVNELPPKTRTIMTLLFYTPALASGVATSIWALIFSGDSYGLLNSQLMSLGIIHTPIQWLVDSSRITFVVVVVVLWSSLGAGFLSFIAGFQTIDKTLYEAGAVDGLKNRYQELWFITLPSMKGQLMFSAIISITSSFGIGAIVTALCGFPSSNYAAHTIMNHLDDYGSIRFEMGYACAIASILFIVMVGVNKLAQNLIAKVGV